MTVINRISTFALHQRTLSDVTGVQTDLANLQVAISSGQKTETFQGLVGEVEQFTGLEAEINKLKNYQTNLAEGISRFQTQRTAIGQMVDLGDQMEDLIVLRRNGANEDKIAFGIQMEGLMKAVARELNTSFGGRFIFGGTRTNVAPVVTEPEIPGPSVAGVPDDGYYQGSKESVILRPRDNLEVEYSVRADNEAFQNLFAAAATALEGDIADDDATLKDAFTMMREGLDRLISLQADTDASILNLQNINERHNSLLKYFQGVSESIINTDLVSASTQLAVDQTVLSASFQAFARINSLHLLDFLR